MTERTQTKTPSGSSDSGDAEQASPFTDTSDAEQTVAELEQKRAEGIRAQQGELEDPLSDSEREQLEEAQHLISTQRAARVAAHGEGGGPWPAELRSRFLNPIGRGAADPAASYTSHEQ